MFITKDKIIYFCIGMNLEDKKNLYKILFLFTIFVTISAQILPVTIFEDKNIYSEIYGIEDIDINLRLEKSVIFSDRILKDSRNSREHHRYTILSIVSFGIGKDELYEQHPVVTDYDINDNMISLSLFNITSFFFTLIGLIFLFFFIYKGIKKLGKKKTNYFLYLSTVEIIVLLLFVLSIFVNPYNLSNEEILYGFSLGVGFYVYIFSICLFFVLHFKQDIFLKYENKIQDIKKDLS